jgi:hypothetical protein
VKARPADRLLTGSVAAGLHASRDSFYLTARVKRQRRAGVIPLDLLPRQCPRCQTHSIVGHGRRLRPCHDDRRQRIWIRRGICRLCDKTFTVLPDWLAPSAPFSLRCRQLACEHLAAGDSIEQAAPQCQDPSCLPDPTTVSRWAGRRLASVCCWLSTGRAGMAFLLAPTIVAWDLIALHRILPFEARSP